MSYDITNKTISSFTMYKFLQDITKPFSQLNAFKLGLIDEEGYFKVSPENTQQQIPAFDLFVIYTKRLFDQIPNPATSAKLNNFTSAMSLFKESLNSYGLDGDEICENILMNLVEQDAAPIANNVGDGNIAGLGYRNYEDGYDDIATHTKKKCKNIDNPLCSILNFMPKTQRRKKQ